MECEHKRKMIPSLMETPKLGITGMVTCGDCDQVIGNCHWEAIGPLELKLKFSPEKLAKEIDDEDRNH